MRDRFHAEPIVQATELLLQERTPRDVAVCAPARRGGADAAATSATRAARPAPLHVAARPIPRTHLLSNGRYAVMVTAAGSATAAGATSP